MQSIRKKKYMQSTAPMNSADEIFIRNQRHLLTYRTFITVISLWYIEFLLKHRFNH